MNSPIDLFISEVCQIFASGSATEHSYRPALAHLFGACSPKGLQVVNEPKQTMASMPDFGFYSKDGVPVGNVEAKDITSDLRKLKGREAQQKRRYLDAFPNLIYTNCLEFEFYRDKKLYAHIKIADDLMGIQPIKENFASLEHQLKDFFAQTPLTIRSAKMLAELMAGKANLMKDIFAESLGQDEEKKGKKASALSRQYQAFKKMLIHDLSIEEFADLYAETVAYGFFAARLHDETQDDFSRQEALALLPRSNPFLRRLFQYVAGYDIDKRIEHITDDLAKIFLACNVYDLFEDFGSKTSRRDPFIHFYETFLATYNPKRRKARGVWYTPEEVVDYIVRAVDDVLKSEFDLPLGLADTSKISMTTEEGKTKEVHRVQVLDPATGTGTFLAQVVRHIAPTIQQTASGMWSNYVEQELIPRLHGFELLMASYTMCHTKLDMIFTELGYRPTKEAPRLNVYLTNALEEGEEDNTQLPFANWLAEEAELANEAKRNTPIMCVIGNPPYAVSSSNKSAWIEELVSDYKRDLGEKNIQPLSDDYIKFLRMGQHLIEKNGEGVLAFITNNSYLDGVIHRQMRKNLLEVFDSITITDLHGSTKKKERAPDGSVDKNVFDIQQGVSIAIFVKHHDREGKPPAQVMHRDLWGTRKAKQDGLQQGTPLKAGFEALKPEAPHYFFVPKDFAAVKAYEKGFKLDEMMPLNSSGIKTHRDHFVLDMDRSALEARMKRFFAPYVDDQTIRLEMNLKDNRDWTMSEARKKDFEPHHFTQCAYRPFDTRQIYYDKSVIDFDRMNVMQHFLKGQNWGLSLPKQSTDGVGSIITKTISTHKSFVAYDQNYSAPLYLYPENTTPQSDLDLSGNAEKRKPNFDEEMIAQFAKALGLDFIPDHEDAMDGYQSHGFTPIDVLDYIYAVLHSPKYRETYAEFLKIDFPRVPYPDDVQRFWALAEKGGHLRRLHLMEADAIGDTPYPFKGEGDNIIEKPVFTEGKVYINKDQYFDTVSELAWGFFIGGYQPAQKWLKDRKGRALSFEDIVHYQKIIKILSETDRLMSEIDLIE